jgi:hypothetical protein
MRRFGRLVSMVLLGSGAAAAMASGADAPLTRTVVAGPQYKAGGGHRWLWGSDYRDLWTTPITLEVLDLRKEAGGLKPLFRVGGQQTKGLAMRGADGKNYTFRGIYKDATELLEEDLRGTIVERVLEDQMAGQHPASEVVVRVLSDAAGIPCPSWRLVVMPDDPSLGEFQKAFAGAIGAFAEYPSAVSDKNPGFRGVTEIIDHAEMYKRLEAGEGDRADDRALLKARLLDIFMGDWDRHRKQWRWAKFPGSPLWQPIPEDRDQAFSRYEGLILDIARWRDARLQRLTAKYAGIAGLTSNGWEQDRRLLVGLTRDDFVKTAEALKGQMTNEVIESAARAMPPEWYRLDGPRLVLALEGRRDALPAVAAVYYEHLADRVDIYLTNKPELVEARRQPNGDMEVRVQGIGADGKASGEPTFQRTFKKGETEEVRLYTLDGNDKTVVSGGPGMRVRMIGGSGADTLDASGSGGAKLSDASSSSKVVEADLDERKYTPPPPPKNAPWIPPRDWGSMTLNMPWIGYSSDVGLFLGWSVEKRAFGFRKDPYSSSHLLRAGFAFGEQSAKVEYSGEYHRENRGSYFGLYAYGSGVEVLRFYGLGNETTNTANQKYYKVHSNEAVLYPSFKLPLGESRKGLITVGPVLKYTDTDQSQDQFVNLVKPYGLGKFGETGVHGVVSYDGRDSAAFTRKGVFIAARGTWFPQVWDVKSAFSEVNGNVNGYLSAGKWLTLAVRGGGKRVFGTYPFQDAATIGSGSLGVAALQEPDYTVRGFRTRRFAGDGSLWGNSDLRLRVSHVTIFVPGHWGVFGFADSGRVWLKSETSNTWHSGVGGGIWLSLLNYKNTFSAGIAHSKEEDLVYVKGGFTF